MRSRNTLIFLATTFAIGTTACDYSGDWLFAGAVEGLPGIMDLGEIEVATVKTIDDVPAAVHFLEIGPTGTPSDGGSTFTFSGTGSDVCVWVDPESATWIQSLSPVYGIDDLSYPDNLFDDGDIDLFGGLAVFYSGSPGESMGNFQIRYEDSLGNVIPIDANECSIPSYDSATGGHAGRGGPEYCTIQNTQPGVSYLIQMLTYSTPMDDERMTYGLMLAHGDCGDLRGELDVIHPECLITEESGNFDADGNLVPYTNAAAFENAFCITAGEVGTGLKAYCEDEFEQYIDGVESDEPLDHIFCGDPDINPFPGN